MWEEIDDPYEPREGEEHGAFVQRLYREHGWVQTETTEDITIEFRDRITAEAPWHFRIEITLGASYVETFLVTDWPSLFLLRPYLPSYGADMDALQAVERMLRRLFHATHGHDADNICVECDPAGMEQRYRARARARS